MVSVDQLTKNTIVSRLHFGESIQVFQSYFNLTRVHNFGAAFGLLSSLPPGSRELFFLVVPIITLLIILFVFYRLREQQGSNVYALSMIMGGALGNLADRIRLGYVIDFFDFHWRSGWHFPAFNIADSAISLGVGLLLLSMLAEKELEGQQATNA